MAWALQNGNEVMGVSRSPEPDPVFLPYKWGCVGAAGIGFRFAQMDLNYDTGRMADAVEEFRPDFIVNFAAQSMVAESWDNPDHWYATNVLAQVRLHERLRKFSFLKKYVHVSTPEVYGSCSGLVTEDASYNPSTPYAASRAACDLHLMTFFRRYGFPVVFTRAANVCGPGQQLYRILPKTVFSILTGRRLPLHGGGHSLRSFIHIMDVAEGTGLVAERGELGQVYHFSTALNISIRELVQKVCVRMGVAFEDAVEISDDRPGKDAAYLLDSRKARKDLGWADARTLDGVIDETIEWVTGAIETLRKLPDHYIHKP